MKFEKEGILTKGYFYPQFEDSSVWIDHEKLDDLFLDWLGSQGVNNRFAQRNDDYSEWTLSPLVGKKVRMIIEILEETDEI